MFDSGPRHHRIRRTSHCLNQSQVPFLHFRPAIKVGFLEGELLRIRVDGRLA